MVKRLTPMPVPISLDEVAERWPRIRQSDLSRFDDCELSSLFTMEHAWGWHTHAQGRGTIFHRVAAECLREMQRNDSETIPTNVALAILENVRRQRNVPFDEIVRVPLRELPELEMVVAKFAADNRWHIRNLIDVERRLDCTISYRDPVTNETRERVLTGRLDALMSRPPDEAIVIDFKDTWAVPPKRDEDSEKPISYHGYFQQQVYGLLVMRNYAGINAVTLQEFYPRKTETRTARIVRSDLPKLETRLSILTEEYDRALSRGYPPAFNLNELVKHGAWLPTPGTHCASCPKKRLCPIDFDVKDGGIETREDAIRMAGARQLVRAIDKELTQHLKGWVDLHGPVPVKTPKGARVLGYHDIKNGHRFEDYAPTPEDEKIVKASLNGETVEHSE